VDLRGVVEVKGSGCRGMHSDELLQLVSFDEATATAETIREGVEKAASNPAADSDGGDAGEIGGVLVRQVRVVRCHAGKHVSRGRLLRTGPTTT